MPTRAKMIPYLRIETLHTLSGGTYLSSPLPEGRYTLKLLKLVCNGKFQEVVLHGENYCFSPRRPLRAVAEVESGSTFRETCLATEVRKSFTKPTMLHGATPAETCFAAPLHTSFS